MFRMRPRIRNCRFTRTRMLLNGSTCHPGNAFLREAVGIHEAALQVEKARTWLVYADDCGFASALIARLTSAGHDVITVRAGKGFQQVDPRSFIIEPANSQHYDSLIRTLQASHSLPAHIVHAWSVTGASFSAAEGRRFRTSTGLGLLQPDLSCQSTRHTQRWTRDKSVRAFQ